MSQQSNYTHTVFFGVNKTNNRKDCTSHQQAVQFANEKLRAGQKAVIKPYKPAKRYVDHLVDRLEKEGRL